MTAAATPKLSIATEFLERAIELFLRGDSFHAALHLAGAAEEILNVYAREMQSSDGARMQPAFDQIKNAMIQMVEPTTPTECVHVEKWIYDRMSIAKNSVKHMRGFKDRNFPFDSEVEAEELINRAISTYVQVQPTLGHPLARLVEAFDRPTREDPAS